MTEADSKTQKPNNGQNSYLIPGAIVVAGALIAFAMYSNGGKSGEVIQNTGPENENGQDEGADRGAVLDGLKPVSGEDHILGNPDAPVKIIEFSDLECPFCKRYHTTLKKIMDEYGKDGKVAWVYRHFPLDQLHPKTRKEAEATECAAELGGNAKFWKYTDRLFEVTPSNNGLDLDELPNIAEYVGLDRAKFEECLQSGEQAGRVEAQYQDAVNSGGTGTPYTIIVSPDGDKAPIVGAQPLSAIKQAIDTALQGQ